MDETVAVVVAAGRGTRFGGGLPKQYRSLCGEPVLRHTVRCFHEHPGVDAVLVVIHPDDTALYQASIAELSVLPAVTGGSTRQQSVYRGLMSLADAPPRFVLIHDAARPVVTTALISRVLDGLHHAPVVIPALPVVDTLKSATSAHPFPLVTATLDRTNLWRAQTPQGFAYDALLAAHQQLQDESLTDDAALAERLRMPIALVPGDEDNAKITSEDDLMRTERTLRANTEVRTGCGFDVHRFTPGDHVMLGGVRIPHTAGLAGHSDADVVLHALTDALLGAIADGDIGSHFPPTDERWRGAASSVFLAHACTLLKARGGNLLNADITVICERPKVGPHRAAIRAAIATAMDCSVERVSVKATTTEGLGFTGRGEGIAAQAIATVSCRVSPPPD
jgi:2-C-methyl-D-erythritol 4-phosphate cytidylyltransferase/2-C-methyl-D-erythritol 2,4-cyclodiphosphate synthase